MEGYVIAFNVGSIVLLSWIIYELKTMINMEEPMEDGKVNCGDCGSQDVEFMDEDIVCRSCGLFQ